MSTTAHEQQNSADSSFDEQTAVNGHSAISNASGASSSVSTASMNDGPATPTPASRVQARQAVSPSPSSRTRQRSSELLYNILSGHSATPSTSGSGTAAAGTSAQSGNKATDSTSTSTSSSWSIMPSWSSPGSALNKNKRVALDRGETPDVPLSATSLDSVGLALDGEADLVMAVDEEPSNSSSGDGDVVVDEGISMSDTSGKVDFLTSFPLEISLYVLLFADVATICQAMQVSKNWQAVCSDPTLWREQFYRNPGWQIRPDYLEAARRSPKKVSNAAAAAAARFSTPTRPRRSTTATSEGSIASRIGRRLGDLVSEVGYLTLYNRSSAEKNVRNSGGNGASPAGGLQQTQSEFFPSASTSTTAEAAQAAPVPSRTRSSTTTSQMSLFQSPLRAAAYRQQSGPAAAFTPSRSRNHTISTIEHNELTTTASIPEHASTSHDNVNGDRSVTMSRGESTRRNRTASVGTILNPASPAAHVGNASSFEFEENVSLSLDWKGLYRDRLTLEQRWSEGRFVTKTLKSHEDSVYCVALHDDMLISGSRDKTIKVWDVRFGELKRTITAHTASVLAIQYDGKSMVTGASNGELFIWDVNEWTVSTVLTGHTAGVLDVQMNKSWIASCSKDTSVRVWNRNTEEPYRVLHGHRGPVNAIQLWQDTVVSASGDSIAKLWDIETGQVIRVFKGHDRGLACIQYNGEILMTGSNDRTIRVWDPNTGNCLKILKGHKDLVRTLAYDAIRNRIFSGSYDKTTRLWDLESGNLKMTFKTSHKSLVFDVGLDVSRIVSCSHDRRIVLIDFGEDLEAHRFM